MFLFSYTPHIYWSIAGIYHNKDPWPMIICAAESAESASQLHAWLIALVRCCYSYTLIILDTVSFNILGQARFRFDAPVSDLASLR